MSEITNSKEFKDIVNDLNIKQFDRALNRLSKLSTIHPNDYYIVKLFASIYLKKLEWNNALKYYEKLLTFNRDKFKIYNDIGVIYFKIGQINLSIDYFKKSFKDKTNAGAYFNLGLAYNEIGKFKYAIENYLAALKIDPNNNIIKKNLINILNYYQPKEVNNNSIIEANYKINQICEKNKINDFNDNNKIKKILSESDQIINKFGANLNFNETQIFRQNSKNLNCIRHFKVFNKFKIIPKYCFSCYKIQINLFNVLDLIKLNFSFNSLYLEKNNIRKCMIELRKNIKINYKGYIYCDSLSEAQRIQEKIQNIIKELKLKKFNLGIKHGCSEFYETYPSFKDINYKGEQSMKYKPEWVEKENIIDKQFMNRKIEDEKVLGETLKGINLSDILIIKNWLIFAKILNDRSYKLIYEGQIGTNFIENILKPQLDFRKNELKY